MAAWCLDWCVEAAHIVGDKRARELGFSKEEQDRMKKISFSMYYPMDAERGVFLQQDTFLDK